MRILAVLIFCAFSVGCVGIAYPSISHTPPIQIDEPDALAFRVRSEIVQSGKLAAGTMLFSKSIDQLAPVNGVIPRQADSHWEYSYLTVNMAVESKSRELQVRLYRRGFVSVIVPAEGGMSSITTKPNWIKANSLKTREEAIDVIAGVSHAQLSPEVRNIVAEEYTWLANSEWAAVKGKEKDRERLLEKARKSGEGHATNGST